MSAWETDDQGNVVYSVLSGFHAAPMGGVLCAVRIEFARTPAQMVEGPEHLQLAMKPDQARLLARDLIRIAENIEGRPAGEHRH